MKTTANSFWRPILMLSAVAFISSCIVTQSALADQTNPSPPVVQSPSKDDSLNNDGVIQLKQLGLGDSVMIQKIKTSHCTFDVSLDGLKKLKSAGISDDVIAAMLTAQSTASANGASAAVQPADLNDPKSPHDSGIYLYEEIDGKAKMVKIEPTVYTQAKSGAGLFRQFGETVNTKAVLHPAHAMLQSTSSKPVFYFYFEHTQSGLGDTRDVATSPDEFELAQLEVNASAGLRSLIVGQENNYTGTQNGPKDQSVRQFNSEKLTPGVYRVSPNDNLANGEYCFFYGGNTAFGTVGGSHKVFDFGVNNPSYVEPPKPAQKHQGK